MEITEYIDKHKKIYEAMISFLSNDEESDNDDDFQQILSYQKDMKEKEEVRSFLTQISKISKNHHRYPNFLNKIEEIINHFSSEIKQTLSNSEIFQIFKTDKRVLYFLFKEKIITADENLLEMINDKKLQNGRRYNQYDSYFYPEFKEFLDEERKKEIEIELSNSEISNLELFERKRKEGENDDQLCEMIRQDSVESFISYINLNKISLYKTKIKPSLFETNSFLIEKEPSLIEYAAFFGSIQIVQYLIFNKVELNESLWIYTIHSKNAELIHLLEKNFIDNSKILYDCIQEAIKCHHNDIANYIIESFLNEDKKINDSQNNFNTNVYAFGLKYFNYNFFPVDLDHKFTFFYFCQFDYLTLVKFLVKYKNVNLQEKIISYYLI